MNRTAFQRDFAIIKGKRTVGNLIPLYYLGQSGRPLLYIFKETLQNVPGHMYFAKGHPMFEQINNLLSFVKSSGFIEHYYKQAEDHNIHLLQSKKNHFKSNVISYE